MEINRNDKRVDTPFKELLAIASDLAFEHSADTQDAYNLTRQAFVHILRDSFPGSRSICRYLPGTKYLH